MIKNYLLVALRNLFSNKLFSTINLVGLSIGLSCVIMISLFVVNESSYDQHWQKADQTYRVMRSYDLPEGSDDLDLATNAPQVGPLLKQDFPQLENVVRILNITSLISRSGSNSPNYEPGIYYTDADVYQVFDIPMIQGQWENALTAPYSVVLNESMAEKYFADSNPIGESLIFNNDVSLVVTGVMADLKQNSHLSPSVFVSMATRQVQLGAERMSDWGNNDYHTYVVIGQEYGIGQFTDEIPDFIQRHVPESLMTTSFPIIPITDIHLNSNRESELTSNGNATLVTAFAAIALLILVIACFNFMNLSTARSIARAEEIGMRKVFGATRRQLIAQFLSESLLLTLIAVLLAIQFSSLLLPWVNSVLGLELELGFTENLHYAAYLGLLAIGVGLLAGSYPAFYMADFALTKVLKGELESGAKGDVIRKSLVIVQFTISVVLIIASGIALSQIRYMLNLDLGLNTERIAVYRGNGSLGTQYKTMKEEILRHPDVLSVTAANLMPSNQNTNVQGVKIEGDGTQFRPMAPLTVDYDFFTTFDIQFLSGRDFSRDNSTDIYVQPSAGKLHTTGAFILNESAVRQLGWTPENAVGRSFENVLAQDGSISVLGTVIGVTEDIYFSSVREQVKPLFYRLMSESSSTFPNLRQMAVKLSGDNMSEVLNHIEEIWHQFMTDVPINQSFLDQNYAGLYTAEQRQGSVFTLFSAVAIFIALIGLFGMASYLTERRTREIGIRKVLGSTILGIVSLLSKDFCKLVLVSNLIAWPIAWYTMNVWIQGFVYRTDIGPSMFVTAAVSTLFMAILTVGTLAAMTASRNPIVALRHE